MASTRLVRKALRNRAVSRKRVNTIKRLTDKPVIKNVDIEKIKEDFAKKPAMPAAKKEIPTKEDPAVAKEVVETPEKDKKVLEASAANLKEDKQKAAKTTKTKTKEEKPTKAEVPSAEDSKKAAQKKAPAKKATAKVKEQAAPKSEKKKDPSE